MARKEKLRLDEETGEFVPVLNEDGAEIPDPVPLAPPIGFIEQRPLHERIRAMVHNEFLRRRAESEVESPEEAEDFLVGDEDDPRFGEKFAVLPGHEHDWEDNYEPPKDFKDMKQRLMDAGWTPPSSDKVEGKEGKAATGVTKDPPATTSPAPAAKV